jgi:Putative transposase
VRGTVLYGPRDIRFEERTAPTIMKPTDAIIRISDAACAAPQLRTAPARTALGGHVARCEDCAHTVIAYNSCRPSFLLPVRVLSHLFRRLLLQKLRAAHKASQLQFFGQHAHLAQPKAFAAYLAPLRKIEWHLYLKPPFGGPEAVLAYLSRYTHRVAIANSRLIAFND